MAIKTQEEIEKLKASWRHDPCWDIEETEGFEDHKEELLAYRKQVEAESEKKAREYAERRAKKVKEETGVTDAVTAQSICTFAEIEFDLNRRDIDALESAKAQVRATLLLAAQVKRVADLLEEQHDDCLADAEREEIRKLYIRGTLPTTAI